MSVSKIIEDLFILALYRNNLAELELISQRETIVLTRELVYRLIRACWTTSLLRGLVETIPRQWMTEPMHNGWTVLHQLTALGNVDFETASYVIRCVPRETLFVVIHHDVGMHMFTACERAFWYGKYDLANALLAHGGRVRHQQLDVSSWSAAGGALRLYEKCRDAQHKARQASVVIYGILRLRRTGIPRDMATNCARELYATRGFEEWTH
jgi:hypothetical protein